MLLSVASPVLLQIFELHTLTHKNKHTYVYTKIETDNILTYKQIDIQIVAGTQRCMEGEMIRPSRWCRL